MTNTSPVLLITGASKGIGAAAAKAAYNKGYRLVLMSRSKEALASVAADLVKLGGEDSDDRIMCIPCDTTDWEQLEEAMTQVIQQFGRLDAVFANAGIAVRSSFLPDQAASPEDWKSMVLTNIYGTAITARATIPYLMKSRGHLVLTGSVTGRVTIPGSLYSATKWAVTGLAQGIRAELLGTGVRTTILQPGLVDTEAISPGRADDPKLKPEDIANALLFALEQPEHVDVNEIVVRPVGQVAWR